MIVGISFFAIGIFIFIKENYNIEIIDGEKKFSKKTDGEKDRRYRWKMIVCVFTFLLGLYRFVNTIIY